MRIRTGKPYQQAQGALTLALLVGPQEGDALGVAAVADGDVHRAAQVHGVVVHGVAALVRVHMPCTCEYSV